MKKMCYTINCSDDWKINQKNVVNKADLCYDIFNKSISYKCEYQGLYYEKMINGNLINNSTISYCKCKTGQCNSCSNINIGKATCKGNYRNGISVIAGNNIIMNEIYIEDTIGSDPQAGIDFEPNHICERIDIKINKIFSKNNYHCGVTTYTSESESIKVSVNEVHSNNDAIAFINGNFDLFAGDVTCDKIKYYFHFKKVYFNYIERRKEYIVTQNWDKGCHSLVVDNITIIE
jgi:hypothetical protein